MWYIGKSLEVWLPVKYSTNMYKPNMISEIRGTETFLKGGETELN